MEDESHNHSSSSGSSSKKKRLLKRAPEAPKRFKSAYICYVAEQLEKAKSSPSGNDMKVTEAMKVLAKKWKALPDNEKEKHEQLAAADKRRYFEELDHYSGPLQIPNKRVKKDPNAPKRAMSAFLSYSQYMRSTARQMFPELKNTELSSALAKMWREASEEEKRPHLEREQRDRSKYHKDMEAWKDLENLYKSEGQSQSNSQSRSVQYSSYSGSTNSIKADGRPVSYLELPNTFRGNESAEADHSNYLDDPNNECNSLWGGTDDADLYTSDLPFDLDGWNSNGNKGSGDDLQLPESESQSDPNSESPGKTRNQYTGSTSSSSAFGSSNRSGGSEKDSGGATSHESNSSLQGSTGYNSHISPNSYGVSSSTNGYVDGCDVPAPNQSKWNRVRESSRSQSQAHDFSSSSSVAKLLPKEPSGRSTHLANAGNNTGKGAVNSISTATTSTTYIKATTGMSVGGGHSITCTTQASVQTKKTGQSSYQSQPYAPGFGPFRGIAKSVHKQQQKELGISTQAQQPHVNYQSIHNNSQLFPKHLNDKNCQQSERSSGRSSSSMTNSSDLRSSCSVTSDSNKHILYYPQLPSEMPYQFKPNTSATYGYNYSNNSQSSIPYQSQHERRDGDRHFHENMMYGNRESYKPHPVPMSSDVSAYDNRKACDLNLSGVMSDFNDKGKNKLNAAHLKQLNQWNAANHQSILNPNSFSGATDSSAAKSSHPMLVNAIKDTSTSRNPAKVTTLRETRSENSARSGTASDVWPFNIDLDSLEKTSDKTFDKMSDTPENVEPEPDFNRSARLVQDGLDNESGNNYDSSYMQFNPPRPLGNLQDPTKFEMRSPMAVSTPSQYFANSYQAEFGLKNNQMETQDQMCNKQMTEGEQQHRKRPDQREQDQQQFQRQREALQGASQSVFAYPTWFNSFMPMEMPHASNNSNSSQNSLQAPPDSLLPPMYPMNYMPTYHPPPYGNHNFNETNSTDFQSFYNPNSAAEVDADLYNKQCNELMSAMQSHPSHSFHKQNQNDFTFSTTGQQLEQQQFDSFSVPTNFGSTANLKTRDVMTTSDYLANRQNRMDQHVPHNARPHAGSTREQSSFSQPVSQQSQKSRKSQKRRQRNTNESVLRTLLAVDEAGLFDNSDMAQMFNIAPSLPQYQRGQLNRQD